MSATPVSNISKATTKLPIVPTLVPWSTSLRWPLRLRFFASGVLFPLICLAHVIGAGDRTIFFDAPWQSGTLQPHVKLILSVPVICYFLPLLSLSFISASVWCIAPRVSCNLLVRLGLWTGFVQAVMFTVLLGIVTFILCPICALVIAPSLFLLIASVDALVQRQFSIRALLMITAGVAVFTSLVMQVPALAESLLGVLMASLFVILIGAAPLGMVTFLRMSYAAEHLHRRPELLRAMPELGEGFVSQNENSKSKTWVGVFVAWCAWLGAFYATWRFVIEREAIEYALLPKSPPQDCYVSSAAARGHPKWVGIRETKSCNVPVNLQMKRLKFVELALRVSMPQAHRIIRKVYDCLGPPLARLCCSSVWFADLTYVMLKPVEFAAVFAQFTFKISPSQIQNLYGSGSSVFRATDKRPNPGGSTSVS